MSNENIKLSELDQNMIIWNAVNTTNPNHVKKVTNGGRTYSSIDATSQYQKATSLHPNNPLGYYGLGYCYMIQGQIEKAIEALQQSIQLKPDHMESQVLLQKAIALKAPEDDKQRFEKAGREERFYEVKPGDSLSKIASAVYENVSEWRKIFAANKNQIENPDLIYPGQKFRIP